MTDRARVLVVYSHPCRESFCRAIRDRVCEALRLLGHEVDLLDLHAEGFQPVLGAEEWRGYQHEGPNLDPVKDHAERLAAADALIFVYPTWWFGLPAILKGWLDRVLVPGFAFAMPEAGKGPRPGLIHIRHLGVFTSCGANLWTSWAVGFPGRRTLLRGVRANCHPLARTTFSAIYQIDSASAAQRSAYLDRIPGRVAQLMERRRLLWLRRPQPTSLARQTFPG